MIKLIINKFKELDEHVQKIMIKGFKFSFIFCIFSTLLLLIYNFYLIPIVFYAGTLLFKSSLMFFASFVILGIGFDTIKKQIV